LHKLSYSSNQNKAFVTLQRGVFDDVEVLQRWASILWAEDENRITIGPPPGRRPNLNYNRETAYLYETGKKRPIL
jgi:hypothetical protein